jgi:O-antigen ligase
MSNDTVTYLVAASCGIFGLAAFVYFVLVPAWGAYPRVWQRVAASFLCLYVLAALLVVGTGIGLGVVYFYDEVV